MFHLLQLYQNTPILWIQMSGLLNWFECGGVIFRIMNTGKKA
jgi:hypothetical protein